ncbi:hypothetical protein HKD37_10G028099 [Glycine soja]
MNEMAPKKLSMKRSRRDTAAEGTSAAPKERRVQLREDEYTNFQEEIAHRHWASLVTPMAKYDPEVVLEFYANAWPTEEGFLGDPLVLEEGQECEFIQRRNRADGFDEEAIAQLLCTPGQDFARTATGRRVRIMRTSMTTLTQTWMTLLLSNVLPSDHNSDLPLPKCQLVCHPDTDERPRGPGMPPSRHPLDPDKSNRALGFPALITGLCQSFGVPVTPSKVIRPPITRAFIDKYCRPRQAQGGGPEGMRRQIMVIPFTFSPFRHNRVRWHAETNYGHSAPFCHPEAIVLDDMRRQIMVIPLTFSPFRHNHVQWHVEINYGHSVPFCHPEAIVPDNTQRQIMVIRTLLLSEVLPEGGALWRKQPSSSGRAGLSSFVTDAWGANTFLVRKYNSRTFHLKFVDHVFSGFFRRFPQINAGGNSARFPSLEDAPVSLVLPSRRRPPTRKNHNLGTNMSLHSSSSVNGEGSTPKDPLYKILDELRSLKLWKEKQERKEKGKKKVEKISQGEREKIREEERRKIMKEMKREKHASYSSHDSCKSLSEELSDYYRGRHSSHTKHHSQRREKDRRPQQGNVNLPYFHGRTMKSTLKSYGSHSYPKKDQGLGILGATPSKPKDDKGKIIEKQPLKARQPLMVKEECKEVSVSSKRLAKKERHFEIKTNIKEISPLRQPPHFLLCKKTLVSIATPLGLEFIPQVKELLDEGQILFKGEGMMQSYPTRALDRRLQEDWTGDAREGPRVLMSLRSTKFCALIFLSLHSSPSSSNLLSMTSYIRHSVHPNHYVHFEHSEYSVAGDSEYSDFEHSTTNFHTENIAQPPPLTQLAMNQKSAPVARVSDLLDYSEPSSRAFLFENLLLLVVPTATICSSKGMIPLETIKRDITTLGIIAKSLVISMGTNQTGKRFYQVKVKSLDTTSIKELGRLMEPLQMQAFRKTYGKILELTIAEVSIEAIASLTQYYDQPLRCFTFADFQLVPTIEEFEEILGCPLGGRKPYLSSGCLPSLSRIATVVKDSARGLDRIKQTRNGIAGLPQKYLEDKARGMANQGDWVPFMDVLALLIFGVVLFPNVDGLVDLAAIDAFLAYHHSKESPVVAILADLFDTFDRRCEKSSARIICCLPALCVWLVSHLFQQDTRHPCPLLSHRSCTEKRRIDWDQLLAGIGGRTISWFPRWKEGKEGVLFSCGRYPNIPLVGTRGCINYNPALAIRQLGYPMRGAPTEESMSPFLVRDFGAQNSKTIQRIHKAWETPLKKDQELRGIRNGIIGGYHEWLKVHIRGLDWLAKLKVVSKESFEAPEEDEELVGYMPSSFADLVFAGERIEVGLKRGKFDYVSSTNANAKRIGATGAKRKEGDAHAVSSTPAWVKTQQTPHGTHQYAQHHPSFSAHTGNTSSSTPVQPKAPTQREAPQVPTPNTTRPAGNSNTTRNFPPRPFPEFTPLPMTYEDLLPSLIANHLAVVTPGRVLEPPFPKWYDPNATCKYHGGVPGHSVEKCLALKYKVQHLMDAGWLTFQEDRPNVRTNPLANHGGGAVNAVESDRPHRSKPLRDVATPRRFIFEALQKGGVIPHSGCKEDSCLLHSGEMHDMETCLEVEELLQRMIDQGRLEVGIEGKEEQHICMQSTEGSGVAKPKPLVIYFTKSAASQKPGHPLMAKPVPFPYQNTVMMARVMLGNGYEPGMGLGKNNGGITSLINTQGNRGKYGLGYKPTQADMKRSIAGRKNNGQSSRWRQEGEGSPPCHISRSFISAGSGDKGQAFAICEDDIPSTLDLVRPCPPDFQLGNWRVEERPGIYATSIIGENTETFSSLTSYPELRRSEFLIGGYAAGPMIRGDTLRLSAPFCHPEAAGPMTSRDQVWSFCTLVSSRGGGPDDTRRYLTVIRTLLSSRGGGPDDKQRPNLAAGPMIRGDTLRLSAPFCHPEAAGPMTSRDQVWSFCTLVSSRGGGPDDTRRYLTVIRTLLSSRGGGPDDKQRPKAAGPMIRGDTLRLSAPLYHLEAAGPMTSRDQIWSFCTLVSSRGGGPDDTRRYLTIIRTLLSSRGGGPDDTRRCLTVIHTLLSSRGGGPDDKQRPSLAAGPMIRGDTLRLSAPFCHPEAAGLMTSRDQIWSFCTLVSSRGGGPDDTRKYPSGPLGPSRRFLQKAVASGGSNPARLGELGGKLLPQFSINRGRSEVATVLRRSSSILHRSSVFNG